MSMSKMKRRDDTTVLATKPNQSSAQDLAHLTMLPIYRAMQRSSAIAIEAA